MSTYKLTNSNGKQIFLDHVIRMKRACSLWRWRVSVVEFVIAAKNIENTSLSIHYYNVKADFLLFFPEAFIIITLANAL